jgi:hypothetical protein
MTDVAEWQHTSLHMLVFYSGFDFGGEEAAATAVPTCAIYARCISGERFEFCILFDVSACRPMHAFVSIQF